LNLRFGEKKEGVVNNKLHSVRKALIEFSCDGQTYTLDLNKPPKTKRLLKGNKEGHLRVRYFCKDKTQSRYKGDWAVEEAVAILW
jgi:hypothetical protein